MQPVALITALALLQYTLFGMLVARARGRTGVMPPATAGHPEFERYYRVQQNTTEQIILFLPSLWLFATYIDPRIAAAIGGVYLIGRLAFLLGYVADPGKRIPGFVLTMLANMSLLLGSIIGVVRAML